MTTEKTDIKQHLLDIEARIIKLSASPSQFAFDTPPSRRDDEIDLLEIWNILWDGKWWIVGITFLFAVLSVVYALSLSNQYKAEVVLAPAQENSGGIGALAAQYGGLAAMAGINLGSAQNSDIDQAIALVKSWPFLEAFVDKYNLKPQIMAIKEWDGINNKIIYNKDIYDPETGHWLREPEPNRPAEPTSYEVFRTFSEMILVSQDSKTGLIWLSVEHYVPRLAYEWTGLLTEELNRHFQARDVKAATRNIEYLREKINETSIAEMQSVFYRMIESQMKTLMLAEVSGEYLLRSVVQAKLPEKKSKPRRAVICVIGVMLGGFIGVFLVLMLDYKKKKRG